MGPNCPHQILVPVIKRSEDVSIRVLKQQWRTFVESADRMFWKFCSFRSVRDSIGMRPCACRTWSLGVAVDKRGLVLASGFGHPPK